MSPDGEEQAAINLECISKLRRNPEFAKYYTPRLQAKLQAKIDEILGGKLDKDELFIRVKEYRELKSVVDMLDEDEGGARRVLA